MILVLYLENPKDTTRKLLELYWTVVRLVNREENSRKENRNCYGRERTATLDRATKKSHSE